MHTCTHTHARINQSATLTPARAHARTNRTQSHHMTRTNESHTTDTKSTIARQSTRAAECARRKSVTQHRIFLFSLEYHGKKHPMPRQTHRRDWVQANSAHCWHKQTYMICSAADKGAGCRHPLNTSLSWYFDTRSSAASSTGSCPTPSSLCIEALGLCGLPPAFGRAVS